MTDTPQRRTLRVKPEVGDDDLVGTVQPEAVERPAMRPAMRAEDPRARAARRALELREHLGDDNDGTDEFYIDPRDIPAGWTYEWKRKLTMGAEDPAYQVALARAGWEAVPTERHPSYMPYDGHHPIIERKGMVLMERPSEIHDEARQRDLRNARAQVRQKEAQLNESRPGEFGKDDPRVRANIKRSYEAIPIPE